MLHQHWLHKQRVDHGTERNPMSSHSSIAAATPAAAVDPRLAPYGVAALRAALGGVMIAHGLAKLLIFTLPGAAAFFSAHGFPGWTAYPVTFLEIVGGILLVLGVYARWIAAVLVPVM